MAERRLSNQIRTLRFLANEMTQAELGQRVGLTRQPIAAVEAGQVRRLADAVQSAT